MICPEVWKVNSDSSGGFRGTDIIFESQIKKDGSDQFEKEGRLQKKRTSVCEEELTRGMNWVIWVMVLWQFDLSEHLPSLSEQKNDSVLLTFCWPKRPLEGWAV